MRTTALMTALLMLAGALAGCLGGDEAVGTGGPVTDYTATDHGSDTTDGEYDPLMRLTLDVGAASHAWDNMTIRIQPEASTAVDCGPNALSCVIIQRDDDDARWNPGETIIVYEQGDSICEAGGCTMSLQITDGATTLTGPAQITLE